MHLGRRIIGSDIRGPGYQPAVCLSSNVTLGESLWIKGTDRMMSEVPSSSNILTFFSESRFKSCRLFFCFVVCVFLCVSINNQRNTGQSETLQICLLQEERGDLRWQGNYQSNQPLPTMLPFFFHLLLCQCLPLLTLNSSSLCHLLTFLRFL